MAHISPKEISNKTGVSEIDCFKVLDTLADDGYLEEKLLTACSHCHLVLEKYNVINELPNHLNCKKCGAETTNVFENTYVVFEKSI